MAAPVLADTGPLVAFIDRNDPAHGWACAQIRELEEPLLTCESVLSECAHLICHFDPAARSLHAMLQSGGLRLAFDLADQTHAVAALMTKYQDVPMSLADACLVRMSELHDRSRVFTLDSDFKLYRRNGRQAIPLLFPAR
ncbi:MAG: type II toxin-antitoxin system VapC family toxin [Opitutales bacterium]